jgi:hypothetical protein
MEHPAWATGRNGAHYNGHGGCVFRRNNYHPEICSPKIKPMGLHAQQPVPVAILFVHHWFIRGTAYLVQSVDGPGA